MGAARPAALPHGTGKLPHAIFDCQYRQAARASHSRQPCDAVYHPAANRGRRSDCPVRVQFVLPGEESAIVHASVGASYSDGPGFRAVTSDDNSPLMLTLPAELLRQKLETLLDGGQVGSV